MSVIKGLASPAAGETVLAAGFPLFSERGEPSSDSSVARAPAPLVSRGEVSGWWPSAPSQILTTCCVQSGASGGPLLRPRPDGSLAVIGILVCNAQLGSGRDAVVYPHVNFALWADALAAPIQAFIESGGKASRHLHGVRATGPNPGGLMAKEEVVINWFWWSSVPQTSEPWESCNATATRCSASGSFSRRGCVSSDPRQPPYPTAGNVPKEKL